MSEKDVESRENGLGVVLMDLSNHPCLGRFRPILAMSNIYQSYLRSWTVFKIKFDKTRPSSDFSHFASEAGKLDSLGRLTTSDVGDSMTQFSALHLVAKP